MDDQAETILLRLMRGSASGGLAGMEASRPITTVSSIQLVRPLLRFRREQTEDYCRLHKTEFLRDEMNENERFARVKVRKQLLPLMKSFNSKVVEALSRTATLLREDDALLSENAADLLKRASNESSLSVKILAQATPAVRRRALKEWIKAGRGSSRRLEMSHLLAVEDLLSGGKGGKVVELPGGFLVSRKRGWLEFLAKND